MSKHGMEDATEYLGFLRRSMRAYGRRVLDGDVEDLAELVRLRGELEELICVTIAELRRPPHSLTWSQVARATGTTRQAAQQRYGGAGERVSVVNLALTARRVL